MVAGAWSRVGCAFPLVPFIFLVCPLRTASQGQPIVVNLGPLTLGPTACCWNTNRYIYIFQENITSLLDA